MPITIGAVKYLTMQDDIVASNLTARSPITGAVYDAHGGYENGKWPDIAAILAKFPGLPAIGFTVFLANVGDGIDVENGDATPGQVVTFYNERTAAGEYRPVTYSGGSDMNDVIADLRAANIPLANVRLLSAHYGWKNLADRTDLANRHICGPNTCGLVSVDMDGTQWCDTATYDESLLRADFFDGPVAVVVSTPPPTLLIPEGTPVLIPMKVSPRMSIQPSGHTVVDILEHGSTVAYLWDDGSVWQTGLNVAQGEPICPLGQSYWLDGDGKPRSAAQLEPFGVNGYVVVATDGGRYNYGS